jgi:hypothetical protein
MPPWLACSVATGRSLVVPAHAVGGLARHLGEPLAGLTWYLLSGLTRVWPLMVTTLYGQPDDRF